MGREEVFVNKEDMALFACPHCGKMKHVSVAKFKDAKHSLRVKCGCGQSFHVDLNFRSKFRKNTSMLGYYHPVGGQRPDPEVMESNCEIVNLSLGGIGIKLSDDKDLLVGDEVIVEFILDDRKKSEMNRRFIVRHVGENRYVGGEFCDVGEGQYDKALGFYLMP